MFSVALYVDATFFPAFLCSFVGSSVVWLLGCLVVLLLCSFVCLRVCLLPLLAPFVRFFVPGGCGLSGIVAVDDHVGRRVPREGALRHLRLRLLRSTAGGHSTVGTSQQKPIPPIIGVQYRPTNEETPRTLSKPQNLGMAPSLKSL